MKKYIDADALIESLSIDPGECPGCPEPEFLPELIEILKEAPAVDLNDCAGCRYEFFGSATCGICSRAYMDRYKEVQHE